MVAYFLICAFPHGYAGMTLGRVVLMTYPGAATIPAGLFDASSVSGTATLSQTVADTSWNNAEVLFAWNCWDGNKRGSVDEIGIGTFFASLYGECRKKFPGLIMTLR